MDKNRVLKQVHKEINELQLLMEGMVEISQIPAPILKLAKSKAAELLHSIELLGGENHAVIQNKQSAPVEVIHESKSAPLPVPAPNVVEDAPEKKEEAVSEIADEVVKKEDVIETPVVSLPDEVSVSVQPQAEEPLKSFQQEETLRRKAKVILGETIETGKRKSDLLEAASQGSLGERLEGQPILDLKKAININDRFMFQKEIFRNDPEFYNEVITTVNEAQSLDEAMAIISQRVSPDTENETTLRFLALVNRRFLRTEN